MGFIYCGSDQDDNKSGDQHDSEVVTIEEVKLKRPRMYKVLLHNDDYSTMEFVIYVLQKFFGKSKAESTSIMLEIHNNGVGLCGVYTFEIAESKVHKVVSYAREAGYPLRCTHEPE